MWFKFIREMKEIKEKLRSARRGIQLTQIGANLLSGLSIVLVVMLILTILNGFLWIPSSARSILFFSWIVISILSILGAIIPPLIRPPSLRLVAIEFERQFPSLREKLITAWDLSNQNIESYGYSPTIVRTIVSRASKESKKLPIKPLLPLKSTQNRLMVFFLVILVFMGFGFAMPLRFTKGLSKATNPGREYPRQTETVLFISLPMNGNAIRFEDYTISIRAEGKLPERVKVYLKPSELEWTPFEAQKDRTNPKIFTHTFRKVSEDFKFYVEGGDFRSHILNVKVLDLPRIIDVSLKYKFPSYTRLAVQSIENNDGNIDVLYGTEVTIKATANKKLSRAVIIFNDSIDIPMEIDGQAASTRIIVRDNGTYKIHAWDKQDQAEPQPVQYQIRVQMDENPVVDITFPARDVDMNEDMILPLEIYGGDDFGFSKFVLKYIVTTRDSIVHSTNLSFKQYGKREVKLEHIWNLGRLDLVPQDLVKYWVEGYDNDNILGPKMGKSKVYTVRFPSMVEIMQEVEKEQNQQITTIDDVLKQQKELIERSEEMARKLDSRREELSYEERQEAQKLIEQQKFLAEKMDQTAQQFQETIQKIEENKLVAQDIIEKMWEVKQLLEDILPEELKNAIRELQEAIEKMDPTQLERAMEKFKVSQQEMIEKLDRTLELLKRIKAEMKLDELKKMADMIKEMQDRINEGLENAENMESLERMEQQVKNQLEQMEKTTKDLADEMKDISDMPHEEMKKIAQELEDMNLPQDAQNALNQMKSNNSKAAQKHGMQLSKKLSDISMNFENMQQNMNEMLQESLNMDMRKTVQELLYISTNIERIITEINSGKDRTKFNEYASELGDLRESLKKVTARIGEMGGKTFMIPPALYALLHKSESSLAQAITIISESRHMVRNPHQAEALSNINLATELLLRTKKAMNQSQCASGSQQLMEKMNQMCNKQSGINQQTMPLCSQCQQPGGLSLEAQAASARLAAEQAVLRKALQELKNELEQHSNLLGRMDETAEDMKKVEEDLRKFNITERTLQRQDRILSRMLYTQKSIHKREFSERRKATTGKDIVRSSPELLPEDLGERKNVVQQALLQILSKPYPRQYQDAVRQYFRALENVGQEEQE